MPQSADSGSTTSRSRPREVTPSTGLGPPALGERGGSVDRGADQGMPEVDAVAVQPDEPRPLRRQPDVHVRARRQGGQHTGRSDALGRRRDQQCGPRRRGQLVHLGGEGPLQQIGDREVTGGVQPGRLEPGRPGPVRPERAVAGRRARKLHQGQRVARGGLQYAAPGGPQGRIRLRTDQLLGLGRRQRGHHQLRDRPVQPLRSAGTARGDEQPDRLARETPGDEPEDLAAPAVDPLGVVDGEQHPPGRGDVRDQGQYGQAHHHGVGRGRVVAQAESGHQGAALTDRQVIGPVQHGQQQLVQPREGQLGLCRVAADAQHPGSRHERVVDGRVQQQGLTDPGLTEQQQRRGGRLR